MASPPDGRFLMRAFRIADRRFPIFDGTGARLSGGRWNSPGRPVIYAAETFAGAVLEVLVHSNLGRVPKTHAGVEIAIPDRIAIEALTSSALSGWDAEDQIVSREYGDKWLEERRTAILLVPATVTRGREYNVLLNPLHPDFKLIQASDPQPVVWDARLFQRTK
ncbi:MAG: RES domain-containing protein [Terracidiphilus sp.]|jgi:RES domain-containing protein